MEGRVTPTPGGGAGMKRENAQQQLRLLRIATNRNCSYLCFHGSLRGQCAKYSITPLWEYKAKSKNEILRLYKTRMTRCKAELLKNFRVQMTMAATETASKPAEIHIL